MIFLILLIPIALLCLSILARSDDYEKRQYIPLGGKKKAIELAKECREEAIKKQQEMKEIHGYFLEERVREIRQQKRAETGVIWGAMHKNADPPGDDDDFFPIAGYE